MRGTRASFLTALTAVAVSTMAMIPASARPQPAPPSRVPVFGYKVVNTFPHDRQAFTQGLQYLDGFLYEGTGQHGQSGIRKVKLETGEVVQRQALDAKYFGEGITVWKNTLIQLTWQSEIGFVYDKASFKQIKTFTYPGEGWGLTHDGKRLIMSDGDARGALRFFDPTTLKETGRLIVRDAGRPVEHLNELEFVRGEVLANVWQTHRIAKISMRTGAVSGWIDLTGILDPKDAAGTDVMNGIAYDAAGDRLFVTGKNWPKLFEIKLVARK